MCRGYPIRALVLGAALAGLVAAGLPAGGAGNPPGGGGGETAGRYFRERRARRPAGFRVPARPAARADLPVVLRDTVVNNTNPDLTRTDTQNDAEPSIAVDPADPNRIVISAFSGLSVDNGGFVPLWYSTDAGETWSKVFTV